MQSLITSLLKDLENFYNFYEKNINPHQIENKNTCKRNKSSRMPPHRIMAVLLMFHLSGYRDFKNFYEIMVKGYMKNIFQGALSYSLVFMVQADDFCY